MLRGILVLRMKRWIAAALALAAAAALGVAVARALTSRELDEPIVSAALSGKVHVRVLLPAGYDSHPHARYPVVYFLHGLPASSAAYRGNDWLLDALQSAGRAILVMPQGARDSDTDAEYLDWGAGRNWSTYVAEEIPRWVDAHFRTLRSRSGRAIVGLSAGGYGATIVGLHHRGTFSVVESWSGYFHATDPTGTKPLSLGPPASAHTLVRTLAADQRRLPTFFAFYVGSGDVRFRRENEQLDAELRRAGVRHTFDVYPGAHETALWQRHAHAWLALALRHLAQAKG